MNSEQAWNWIKDHWNAPSWVGLPENVKKAIGLNASLGVCNGMFVTQQGALGLQKSIQWLNRVRKS